MTTFNRAFISYRRDPGYPWARLIWEGLRDAGIDAFLDLESLDEAGDFNARILNQIAGRPYFVIVLTDGTLDRCANPGDWLWRELEYAVTQGRIIVPAMIQPFDMADAKILPDPGAAQTLRNANGVTFLPAFFDAAMQQLVGRLQPVDLMVRSFSSDDHDFARRAHDQVAGAPDESDHATPLPDRVEHSTAESPPAEPDPEPRKRRRRLLLITGSVVALCLVGVALAVALDWFDPSSNVDSEMSNDELLEPGQQLRSADGRHVLEMTAGGRLIALTDGREWWFADFPEHPGAVATMQDDGNFVVYKPDLPFESENALWASRTQVNPDAVLTIGDQGGRGMILILSQEGRTLFREVDDMDPATTQSF